MLLYIDLAMIKIFEKGVGAEGLQYIMERQLTMLAKEVEYIVKNTKHIDRGNCRIM